MISEFMPICKSSRLKKKITKSMMASVCKFEPQILIKNVCKNHECVYCEYKCGYYCKAHYCSYCEKTGCKTLNRRIVGNNYEVLVQTIFREISEIKCIHTRLDYLLRPLCMDCEIKVTRTVCLHCYMFGYSGFRKLADQNEKCDICKRSYKVVDLKKNRVFGRGCTTSFEIYCESCANEISENIIEIEKNYVDGEPVVFSLKYGSRIYNCLSCKSSLMAAYCPKPLELIAAKTIFKNLLPTDNLPISLQKLVSGQAVPYYIHTNNINFTDRLNIVFCKSN